jgi:hypothetical protein
MRIFVLTATYELRVSRKNRLRDHPIRKPIKYPTREYTSNVLTSITPLPKNLIFVLFIHLKTVGYLTKVITKIEVHVIFLSMWYFLLFPQPSLKTVRDFFCTYFYLKMYVHKTL